MTHPIPVRAEKEKTQDTPRNLVALWLRGRGTQHTHTVGTRTHSQTVSIDGRKFQNLVKYS